MSTRSYVGTIEENVIRFIYVHFDGYLTGVGQALKFGFPTIEDIKPIIDLGDREQLTLSTYAGDGKAYAEYGEPAERNAAAIYPIENGDKDKAIKQIIELADRAGAEFLYLLDNNTWRVWHTFMQWKGQEDTIPETCKADFAWQIARLAQTNRASAKQAQPVA